MDSASDISNCKRLLEELDAAESIGAPDTLDKLALIFEHLPPQVAPRLQKDYDQCTSSSDTILGNLFDKVDISDKNLLNVLLKLLLSYGRFRTAQITYYIESYRDEVEPDLRYTPIIVKTKWYDLTPLLPPAGTIGWKGLLIHSSLKDPDQIELMQTSSKLLFQKLHFYAIMSQLDRFWTQRDTVMKNGQKVASKLAERVFDAANDDQDIVDLDAFQFGLISIFTKEIQLSALVEAIIIAHFKSDLPPEFEDKQEKYAKKLTSLIRECLMDKPNLQETFVIKSIEQLKYNLIRRKRRHSTESQDGDSTLTLESILGELLAGTKPVELLSKARDIKLSSKTVHRNYLEHWVKLLDDVTTKKTLTTHSSSMLITTLSMLLVAASNVITCDLSIKISLLLAKFIDITTIRRLDKFFKQHPPSYLSEFTVRLAESTDLLDDFDTPIIRFFKSYLSRYMRHAVSNKWLKDAENLSQFVEFLCDKAISKSKLHVLEYAFLCELTELICSTKGHGSRGLHGNLAQTFTGYGRTISKRMYKFIKHRPFTKTDVDCDETMTDSSMLNGDNGASEATTNDQVQAVVIDALVCIINMGACRKDQQMLDTYGELLLKLYNLMCDRFGELVRSVSLGREIEHKAIDLNLHRLMDLYIRHTSVIKPYLCYDLNTKICQPLISDQIDGACNTENDDETKDRKVAIYEDLKVKLETIAEKDILVYQTIINSQYASVVDQSINQASRIDREEVCYNHYLDQMVTMSEVLTILFQNCNIETYNSVLNNVVKQFETCDALNHPRVLSLFYTLESLVPRNTEAETDKSESFKQAFPLIGCCLIRIAKSVELGPSVISFTDAGTHKSSGGIQCCTYSHCIRIYALIFNRYPATFTNSLMTDALQICISSNLMRYAKYSNKLHRFFIQLASSIARLLKAFCMGKRESIEQVIPVFLSVFSLLVRCIILASDRKKLEELPQVNGHGGDTNGLDKSDMAHAIEEQCKVYEAQLEQMAHDIGRLANNLCFLETRLVDYAPHLISTYIKDTQRASCPRFVKKHLDEGIFRIFNLVDSYQKDRQESVIEAGVQRKTTAGKASGSLFEMIHARLDQASREIFKDMHDEYNRFHRYLGKC